MNTYVSRYKCFKVKFEIRNTFQFFFFTSGKRTIHLIRVAEIRAYKNFIYHLSSVCILEYTGNHLQL